MIFFIKSALNYNIGRGVDLFLNLGCALSMSFLNKANIYTTYTVSP